MVDCLTYCKSIIDKMAPILDKKKKLEAEHINKVYSAENLKKSNELYKQLDKLQEEHALCRIDCERRNRHRVSDEEQQPIDETLRKELEELESHDDYDGGNKHQSRRRRRRRRRSFRNKTNQKHSRRYTRNARRRGRGQRTRRPRK